MLKSKAYVLADGTVTIICPVCKQSIDTTVAEFRDIKHSLYINCICKAQFMIDLDFRVYYRKEVDLPGRYRIIAPPYAGQGTVQINNISMSGIGFTVPRMGGLEKGQTVELDFQLTDQKQTRLVRQVVCIRTVENGYLGCEFSNNDPYEKNLGYFLST